MPFPFSDLATSPFAFLITLHLKQGTEKAFVDKCHYHHSGHPMYGRPKQPKLEFCIKHYAGPVAYHVESFIGKNRDILKPEVMQMFKNSHNQVSSSLEY